MNNRSRAVCFNCKKVKNTVLQKRDVPFSDGRGTVYDLDVYVCVDCGSVLATPSYATEKIKKELVR